MVRSREGPLLFYGWIIAVISFLTLAISFGVRASFSVFYVAILNEFGWARADTALIFSTGIIVYGLMSPLAGSFVERFGPRRVLLVGSLMLGLGMAGCSQANTIWHFCLLYGGVGSLGIALVGYVPNSAILANWFVKRRGAAFGILNAGFGLCGSVTLLAQWLISTVGWRMAFLVLSVIPPTIVAPLTLIFIRHRPQDIGLLPDGASRVEPDEAEAAQESPLLLDEEGAQNEWTVPKAVRTYRFWALFLTSFFVWGFGCSIIFVHQIAFFVDIGFTAVFAASIAFFHGAVSLIGNGGGLLSDRIGREKIFSLACAGIVLGTFLLITIKDTSSPWLVYLFAVIFGLGVGGVGPAFTASVADIFHGRSFGVINGLVETGFAAGAIFGPWLAGYIYDVNGSYTLAFFILILAVGAAIACMWIASPRKVRSIGGKSPA